MNLLQLLLISVGFNVLMFLPAYFFKTDKLTDASYSVSFIFLSLIAFSLKNFEMSKLILLIMICVWALRLLIYLFIRIVKIKKDNRFDGMRENFFSFFRFWLLQGISVFVILVPVLISLNKDIFRINIISYLGLFIFLVGFLIETIADIQKFKFNSDLKNKGKWIDKGLWKFSRHPNYFGESLVWIGIYLFCFPNLINLEKLFGLISPVFILVLLLFISGIPLLEKRSEEKFGKNKEYQEYKKRTSVFIPWFKK